MALLDLFDQIAVTTVVRRNIEIEANRDDGGEDRGFIGAGIAPLVPVQSRVTRIAVADVLPFGLGQFKAPDATPPLFKAKPKLEEKVIELVLLEEMERITGEEWIKLNSVDPLIARGAMLSLVDRLRIMTQRNDVLTEWMRWQAFKGVLTVTYPEGYAITVDYGLAGSHMPAAATAWTDLVNADPLQDLFAWSQIGSDDAGQYYRNVYLNTTTWRLVVYNEKVKSYLSALGRSIMLPTRTDIQALMREGTGNFVVNDGGYLPEGATQRKLTKFLPDNRLLMTTDNVLSGQRIADVADGQVLVGGGTGTAPDIRQGFQVEIIANPFSKNVFRRVATARIPRIYMPDAFAYASVGA